MNLYELYAKLDEAEMLLYKVKNTEGELGKEYLSIAKDIIWGLKYKAEKEIEKEKANGSEDRETTALATEGTETAE